MESNDKKNTRINHGHYRNYFDMDDLNCTRLFTIREKKAYLKGFDHSNFDDQSILEVV